MPTRRALTIYYNPDSGEMTKVNISDEFKQSDSLLQTDVYHDIYDKIEELKEEQETRFYGKPVKDLTPNCKLDPNSDLAKLSVQKITE